MACVESFCDETLDLGNGKKDRLSESLPIFVMSQAHQGIMGLILLEVYRVIGDAGLGGIVQDVELQLIWQATPTLKERCRHSW